MGVVKPLPRYARERRAPGRLTRGSMVRSTEGEGDRVVPLYRFAVSRPDHPHLALRAVSVRFAAQPRMAGEGFSSRVAEGGFAIQ